MTYFFYDHYTNNYKHLMSLYNNNKKNRYICLTDRNFKHCIAHNVWLFTSTASGTTALQRLQRSSIYLSKNNSINCTEHVTAVLHSDFIHILHTCKDMIFAFQSHHFLVSIIWLHLNQVIIFPQHFNYAWTMLKTLNICFIKI